MNGTNSKLSLKGDRDTKLTFQRQVPTFLKQYSHLLGSKRADPRQEDEPQYETAAINSVKEVIAGGMPVVRSANSGRDSEDEDEDFVKIRALYESEVPKQDKHVAIVEKPKIKTKEQEEEAAFNPNKKVVFKRKSASSGTTSSAAQDGVSANSDSVGVDNSNKKKKTAAKSLLSFDYDE